MKFCQITLLILVALQFFAFLRADFYGTPERKPGGFGGAIGTILASAFTLFVYWKAGAFSTFFQ